MDEKKGRSDGGQMATYKQKTWRKNQECQRPEGRLEKRRDGKKQKIRLLMIEREEEIEKKYPNKDKKNADPRGENRRAP